MFEKEYGLEISMISCGEHFVLFVYAAEEVAGKDADEDE